MPVYGYRLFYAVNILVAVSGGLKKGFSPTLFPPSLNAISKFLESNLVVVCCAVKLKNWF